MARLAPISVDGQGNLVGTQAPLNICEICGGTIIDTDNVYMLNVGYAQPGKGKVGHACPAAPHVACSHQCARIALRACMDEHLHLGKHGNDKPLNPDKSKP